MQERANQPLSEKAGAACDEEAASAQGGQIVRRQAQDIAQIPGRKAARSHFDWRSIVDQRNTGLWPRRERGGAVASPARLTVLTLLFVAIIFAALQCRKPFFTMTDDNLAAGYPFFCEVGNHLLHGESPRYSGYIFGGHYDFLRDVQYFSWHPVYLLVSLLAGTPFHLCILDVDALFLYLLAAAGFARLACALREEGVYQGSDTWLLFCTLSFTFTMMALTTCASWLSFENNTGALPWLTLGILQKEARWGIGLVAFFSLHQILGGHPEPLVTNSLFLSIFAAGVGWWRRSWRPLLWWGIGTTLAVILVLPLLIPALEGFFTSGRSTGTVLSDMQSNRIPADVFSLSFLAGTALSWWNQPPNGTINGIFIFSLGTCAGAWCLLPAMFSRAPWRFLEGFALALTGLAVLLVCRPLWVSEILLHVPLLKAMRWPFRELVQLQFFFHLFLLLRPVTCRPRTRFLAAWAGSLVFAVPMLLYQVTPTFNDMPLDRQLVLSGKFDTYWAKVGKFFQPGDRFVILMPEATTQTDSMFEPYSLLGAYNYPMLAHVVCASGYSQTAPADQRPLKTALLSPWGAYKIDQRENLLREDSGLKFITIERRQPLQVTLSSRDGPVIDLTPYIRDAL